MKNLDPKIPPTPCFVVDLAALRRNLEILNDVRQRAGVKILLAQKAFSMFAVYPMISAVLDGTCASSPHEAHLGREEFGKETHGFAAAYSETDLREMLRFCTTVVFNSFSQWRRYRALTAEAADRVRFGLRVNPEHGEAVREIYSPCAPKSRLGIKRAKFAGESLDGISGLHFHTLCEQDSDALERTMEAFEAHFGDLLKDMQWVNFGGGHHITRPGYDIERLVRILTQFRARYPHLTVYLEPGEAGLNIGLAGIPWWTTDIGGFMTDDVNDPAFQELLIRWYQFAVYSAVLRMHGDRGPYNIPPLDERERGGGYLHTGQPNELWSYGEENYRIMRKYYDVRIAMHDYIRDLYREAHETGAPLIRTMFFEFPEDARCWELQDQYMFGSRYLVAPVLELHQRERQVYLPEGRWKDLNSGEITEGGRTVTAPAPIDVIPVYEKV